MNWYPWDPADYPLFCIGKQFERLFQFARRIEDLMFTVPPEEVCVYSATFLSFIDSRVLLPAILHLVMCRNSIYRINCLQCFSLSQIMRF